MRYVKNTAYLAICVGMLVYALPLLEFGQGFTAQTIFAIAWLMFTLLIVAAHLHHLLGVDEAQRERLEHVKRMRNWQRQQFYRRKIKPLFIGEKSRL